MFLAKLLLRAAGLLFFYSSNPYQKKTFEGAFHERIQYNVKECSLGESGTHVLKTSTHAKVRMCVIPQYKGQNKMTYKDV